MTPDETRMRSLPGFEHGIPQVTFNAKAMIKQAQAETGYSDWGDPFFTKLVGKLVKAINKERRIHSLGRFLVHETLSRLLRNRLMIHHDLATHPEIHDVPIKRPLYILGLPRTGTTFLHNLLASDPNARSIALWEGLYPSPPPDRATRENNPRIALAEQWAARRHAASPLMKIVHPRNPTGPDECHILYQHTLLDGSFKTYANVPGFVRLVKRKYPDPTGMYQYYRTLLQLLAWRCNGRHWVLKSPRGLYVLPTLLKIFPDARIVQTHRNPAKSIASLCSFHRGARSAYFDYFDAQETGQQFFRRVRRGLMVGAEARKNYDPKTFLDIRYPDLVADPIATVKRIYEYHDYPYSDAFEANMKQWLAQNPQHKHGKHEYTLEDYGLEPAVVEQAFKEYCAKFDLDGS